MPRRRQRKTKRGPRRGRALPTNPRASVPSLSQTDPVDLHEKFRAATLLVGAVRAGETKSSPRRDSEASDSILVQPAKTGTAEIKTLAVDPVDVTLPLLRSLFKADRPYRTKLSIHTLLAASATGVVNTSYTIAGIASCAEWASIDAIFDEAFVHSLTATFSPFNYLGLGLEATAQPSQGTYASTAAVSYVLSTALIWVSLFNNSGAYTNAQAMSNNPSRRIGQSGAPIKYTWRNNVRFDPRGISYDNLTAIGWQGWFLVSDVSNLGGKMQVRAVNDQVLGDAAHAVNLGQVELQFDVSFRSRA